MIQKLFKFMEAKPEFSHRPAGCFSFLDFQPCRTPGCHLALDWWYCSTATEEEERKRRERKRQRGREAGVMGGPPVPGSQPPSNGCNSPGHHGSGISSRPEKVNEIWHIYVNYQELVLKCHSKRITKLTWANTLWSCSNKNEAPPFQTLLVFVS